MKHCVRRAFPALLIAAVCASTAHAAVYIPTKTADTNDGACDPNDCSLREAVAAANQHAGDDVILLDDKTYTLSLSPGSPNHLDVDDNLIILGEGAPRTVIDGGNVSGIFYVSGDRSLEIRDLTLRNGRAPGVGGAIRNDGELTLLRAALVSNSSVPGSGAVGMGGAIHNEGILTITDSLIANNTAQSAGGGLTIGGTATLTNVTISGNRSTADFGGGLYVFSDGRATLNNVTVTGNAAAQKGGGAFIENSAFIGASPKITNSILAGNTASSDPDCSGAIDSGFDIIGNNQGCTGPSAAKSDIVGTPASPRNPGLGPLADNGGSTPTHALLNGSPALNSANPAAPGSGGGACAATDQRGTARPGSFRCDIGAFERTAACVAGGNTLCLQNGRFRVTATFQDQGSTRAAQAQPLTDESGFFAFSSPSDIELTVKILNTCATNNRYGVFLSGLTNAAVTVTVADLKAKQTKTYTNPAGRVFQTRLDAAAFATCP
ncbi:MAG TPA: CSLREA domain-containing protein [Thermoanaerobaculia bacterium]